MLNQLLASNQDLTLNNSFKVYINILSIEHMRYKAHTRNNKKSPKRKITNIQNYGHSSSKYQNYWSIDIPQNFENFPDIFKDKCFLICSVLGILQHSYFENLKDKRFLYIQNIVNSNLQKRNRGIIFLQKELEILENKLGQITNDFSFENLAINLSNILKCQFIIFTGKETTSKMHLMIPPIYDDSLKPIFLYQPINEENHLVFIRHISAYFRSNLSICLACKKSFKSGNYRHNCTKKNTCFSCKRFFINSNTYLNSKLKKEFFCDGKKDESFFTVCFKCKVNILTPHCLLGHRRYCNAGLKCLKCKKYTYRNGQSFKTLEAIQNSHKCGYKLCSFCDENYLDNLDSFHLCKLQTEILKDEKPCLVFLTIQFVNENFEDPVMILMFKQTAKNNFDKITFSFFDSNPLIESNIEFFDGDDRDLNFFTKKTKKSYYF